MTINELQHHGILGQKWGVRRFQNKDGSLTSAGKKRYSDGNSDLTFEKGYEFKRVSTSSDDPVYDNKKYLSIDNEDNKKWDDYIGGHYARRGYNTYSNTYEARKNLNIMGIKKQGELYANKLLDSEFANMAMRDLKIANSQLNLEETNDDVENISRMIAMQTETGKKFVEEVMNKKYDGIVDKHGMNVSDMPIIVFNPDQNIKRIKVDYTDAVKNYYR